jgi:hypothetical protein
MANNWNDFKNPFILGELLLLSKPLSHIANSRSKHLVWNVGGRSSTVLSSAPRKEHGVFIVYSTLSHPQLPASLIHCPEKQCQNYNTPATTIPAWHTSWEGSPTSSAISKRKQKIMLQNFLYISHTPEEILRHKQYVCFVSWRSLTIVLFLKTSTRDKINNIKISALILVKQYMFWNVGVKT